MTIRNQLLVTSSSLALAAVQPALAQDFYAGLALEMGSSDITESGGDPDDYTSESDLRAAQLILGMRFFAGEQLFFGGELETSLNSEVANVSTAERLSRLRAIVGYKFARFSVFGAAGVGRMDGIDFDDGEFDLTDVSMSGMTYGLGAEMAVGPKMDIRLEVLFDDFEGSSGGYDYAANNRSLRLGAVVKF